MDPITIFTVVGARPQFVKSASVSRVMAGIAGISEFLVHTGQHFDPNMSDVFFEEMEIRQPAVHLNIHGMTHGAMTGRMMESLEELMMREKPDLVLVYGDTNSTLAAALTAAKLHIKVAHVEAGLRSFNTNMPEEINRILTDRISNILYCPTSIAMNNLMKEGFDKFNAHMVLSGDVMYDSVLYYAERAKEKSRLIEDLKLNDFMLCTLHRAENTDEPKNITAICRALNRLNEHMEVVLPLHPRAKKMIQKFNIKLNVRIIEPIGYFDMLSLLSQTKLILTDSGGLQKEAYFFKKPCVTLRDQTEWVELIDSGTNILTGANEEKIVTAGIKMLARKLSFDQESYGNGHASELIVSDLLTQLSN